MTLDQSDCSYILGGAGRWDPGPADTAGVFYALNSYSFYHIQIFGSQQRRVQLLHQPQSVHAAPLVDGGTSVDRVESATE